MVNLLESLPQLADVAKPEACLERTKDSLLAGISACREKRLFGPALIILYSGIDIMGSLSRPPDRDPRVRNTKDNFKRWARDFLLPNSGLKCNEDDLYAARCGLIHSLSYRSVSKDKPPPRSIEYIYDDIPGERRGKQAKAGKDPSIIVVELADLSHAFETGLESFYQYVISRNDTLVLGRVNEELAFFPLALSLS
jgi:hypothetical protein